LKEGAFLVNSTSRFLSGLTACERQAMRNVCHAQGYETLALVPIWLGRDILGLIHIADRRENMLPEDMLGQLQEVAMQIGAAITRISAQEALRQAYGQLEERIAERTAELTAANRSLQRENEERRRTEAALKLNEARLEALYRLSQMDRATVQEVCDFAVEEGVRLTQSRFGYLFFMNREETVLTVHSWCRASLAVCKVTGMPRVYAVRETGLWGEAVRQRRPIITNDYGAPNPMKRGYPDGHVPIFRHMNIPVFENDRIVAVAGVANKASDYVDDDVRQLQVLMKGMWRLVQRKRSQDAMAASEDKLRTLTTQLLNAQEKERKRISIELHDELGQALLTLKLQLRALQQRLRDDQAAMKADFELVFMHINAVTENVRRMSKELSPSILEDLGLVAALNWLVKRVGKHHCIDIDCDAEAIDGIFGAEAELLLFRIFQEALTNIAKHARARQAAITAKRSNGGIIITIEDTGIGFDVESKTNLKSTDRGLGLAAMDERVRMLGGTMDIRSRRAEGTRIRIGIPLTAASSNRHGDRSDADTRAAKPAEPVTANRGTG
jgi:signal transduction histidine kinase